MAHPQEKRERLRQLYVSGAQTLETAAIMCEVPQATARSWKRADKEKGNDWDKLRAAYTLAGGGIEDLSRAMLAGFMVQYNSTMTMLQDSSIEDLTPSDRAKMLASLADAFTKTVAANARVMPETSKLATALELIEFLMVFVQEKHPKHLAAFVEVLEPFGVEVERKFG
ncbi:DUF1804 domain-containing protein [Neisseria sp. N95_16]|uniref:DUF1804 family protein n=1 Tax=Neisseria brasiliensis TaxID=2666100 RepID=A0A5Q3S2A6_9NEIS|nr:MULTISPECIES: DUF1804 family protein [Neisseria]MRN38944.1 DUF1804 family protein [Neisseria brasiliensis]MRN39404.1 DUF1804 family protein [Neisseria brasiliensis]PJO08857.1 DUF1804 domain-containing protein [Neisseria sp. N95_16]PJO78427.1 DUF1804 domain-containing protein [Neisseria sp. N177_16]QGL26079.1 DUF1804 family protein [Neisseria brasiliensis]